VDGLPDHSAFDGESPRVELVPHVVEPRENFWTISRLYYGSGRYYRALWKANATKFPVIHRLHVGDIILIPPVEDLDPAYIDSPRIRTVPAAFESEFQNGVTEPSEPPASSATGRESIVTERTSRTPTAASSRGVAVRRSRPTDALLDLPVGESVARRDSDPRSPGLDRENDEKADVGPAIRVPAGSHGSAPSTGPVYKVRPYDTLRSIARDTLGDAHRASEILDLNRGLIDDPNHLNVGQLIELPEDADIQRATIRK
jgi:nucleoid-associated protein YgaU